MSTRKICNAQRLPLLMTIPQYDAVPQDDVKGTHVDADKYDAKRPAKKETPSPSQSPGPQDMG